MKFGRIKRQHGRVLGLDEILNQIIADCPHVSRIVPGRIKVRRGKKPPSFKVQYPTPAGLKCLYTSTGTVQEVFLICPDMPAARQWLLETGIAEWLRGTGISARGIASDAARTGHGLHGKHGSTGFVKPDPESRRPTNDLGQMTNDK